MHVTSDWQCTGQNMSSPCGAELSFPKATSFKAAQDFSISLILLANVTAHLAIWVAQTFSNIWCALLAQLRKRIWKRSNYDTNPFLSREPSPGFDSALKALRKGG